MRNEKGFTLMGLLIIVIVLVVIGAACFFVFRNGKKVETTNTGTTGGEIERLDIEDDSDVVQYDLEDRESGYFAEDAIDGYYNPDDVVIKDEEAEAEAEAETSSEENPEESAEGTVTE